MVEIMNVEEAILIRRSVRSYQDKKIPRSKLQDILDKVRMAPSANNRQEWKFVIVDDENKKEKLCERAINQSFVKEASAVIAGVNTETDYVMSCGTPAGIVDLSIALDHLTLKAAEEGLGTCWIGSFEQGEVKKMLEIPNQHNVVTLMTIGYPKRDLKKSQKNRKTIEEVSSYNNFSE